MKKFKSNLFTVVKNKNKFYLENDEEQKIKDKFGKIKFEYGKASFKLVDTEGYATQSDYTNLAFFADGQAVVSNAKTGVYANVNFITGEISQEFGLKRSPYIDEVNAQAENIRLSMKEKGIEDENYLATLAERKKIEKPIVKPKKVKTKRDFHSVSPTLKKTPKYTEDEKIGYSLLSYLVTDSILVGALTYSTLDTATESSYEKDI